MSSDGDRRATNDDQRGDDERRDDQHGTAGAGGEDAAAWLVRVVDALGPLDEGDREVLGRLLNRRAS